MKTSNTKVVPSKKDPDGKKQLKPGYSDFLQDLKKIIGDEKNKNPINNLYKHLRKGFQDKIKPQHCQEIVACLINNDYFDLLAIKIAISCYSSRSPDILKKLNRNFKEIIAQQVNFPTEININYGYSERRDILESWVRKHIKDGVLNYNWARRAVLCLIYENISEKDLEIIQLIIEHCIKPKTTKAKKFHDQKSLSQDYYKKYTSQLLKLFLAREVPKGKIANFVTFFTFNQKTNKTLIDEKNELSDRVNNLEYELNDLKAQFAKTTDDLSKTEKKKKQFENLLNEKEVALKKENKRYQELENYWKKESTTRVSKQTLSFIKDFEHEIQEAKLSLEGDNPDISMALSRIKHMEEYLSKYGDQS